MDGLYLPITLRFLIRQDHVNPSSVVLIEALQVCISAGYAVYAIQFAMPSVLIWVAFGFFLIPAVMAWCFAIYFVWHWIRPHSSYEPVASLDPTEDSPNIDLGNEARSGLIEQAYLLQQRQTQFCMSFSVSKGLTNLTLQVAHSDSITLPDPQTTIQRAGTSVPEATINPLFDEVSRPFRLFNASAKNSRTPKTIAMRMPPRHKPFVWTRS